MQPTLKSGDILLLRKHTPVAQDIVVVAHPTYGRIVKRLANDGRLSGDDPSSTSSDELGFFDIDHLIGVAFIAITPSGLRRL